jgi:hypothetical protein
VFAKAIAVSKEVKEGKDRPAPSAHVLPPGPFHDQSREETGQLDHTLKVAVTMKEPAAIKRFISF